MRDKLLLKMETQGSNSPRLLLSPFIRLKMMLSISWLPWFVVQSLSRVWLFVTSRTVAHQSSPVLRHLPEFAETHVHWFGDAIQPAHPLSSPVSSCPLSFPASGSFPVSHPFSSGGQSISFSISPSNEYSWLISFRIDLCDLLAVQGTLKSLLQHHSSKASILIKTTLY